MKCGAIEVLGSSRVIEHFHRIVDLVGVVVIRDQLRVEASRHEGWTEVVLDEQCLVGRSHGHAGVVAPVERLVLHGEVVDVDAQ